MSTTDSLPVENPSQPSPSSQVELAEASLREGLELGEGLRRLGRMIGLDSIKRNLDAEDAMVKRSFEAGSKLYSDGNTVTQPSDEMDVMAARDVIVNHHYPQSTTTPAVTPEPKSTLADKAKQAALIAAIAAGGSAVPLLYQYFNQAPVVEAPAYDPSTPDFNLLPPDPAPGDTK